MVKRLLSVFLLIRGYAAFAQDTTADSSFTTTALHNAVASYHHYIDKQSRLYNGIEYIGYSPKIEGIPYFLENTWQRGSIVYDGIAYDTVKMMYDMVKDRVIILHFNGFYRLALFSEKVKSFSLMNHHFVRIEQDSLGHSPLETGFYDQLYTGPSAVLARRSKFIEETVREQLDRKFIEQHHYYIYKDGNYHAIRTKKALFSLLKDRARELKQYLRNQKLKFGKDKEKTILQAATHYDSLKN